MDLMQTAKTTHDIGIAAHHKLGQTALTTSDKQLNKNHDRPILVIAVADCFYLMDPTSEFQRNTNQGGPE